MYYISECDQEYNFHSRHTASTCEMYPKLDRFQSSKRNFYTEHVHYLNETKPTFIPVTFAYNTTTIIPFELKAVTDVGGTLKWTISMHTEQKVVMTFRRY